MIEGDILMSSSDGQRARMSKCSLPHTHIPYTPPPSRRAKHQDLHESWEREEGFQERERRSWQSQECKEGEDWRIAPSNLQSGEEIEEKQGYVSYGRDGTEALRKH